MPNYSALDNDEIRWCANRFGKPRPTDGECNNIRQQMARVKGTDTHITTDGQRVFAFKSNADAFKWAYGGMATAHA